jgi:hypothetical protein
VDHLLIVIVMTVIVLIGNESAGGRHDRGDVRVAVAGVDNTDRRILNTESYPSCFYSPFFSFREIIFFCLILIIIAFLRGGSYCLPVTFYYYFFASPFPSIAYE